MKKNPPNAHKTDDFSGLIGEKMSPVALALKRKRDKLTDNKGLKAGRKPEDMKEPNTGMKEVI